MPVNDKITQAEYNNIRTKVIGVLGTGSGNSGYGQPLNSSAVALGNRVTINEYANLRLDIINAWVHQVGSAPTTVTVAEGNTIRFSAVDAPVTTYDTLANTLITNRFNVGSGQSSVSVPTGSPRSRTWTGTGGDYWTSQITCTIDATWPNSNAARFFFNSGGQIRITSSRTGGSIGSSQNTSWTNILTSAGMQGFGANNPGTGTSPSTGGNWYRLTNSFQNYYTLAGSTPYGSNSYNLQARVTDVANNATGTAASSQIRVVFTDSYVDPGQHPSNPVPDTIDAIDGTFSIAVSVVYATGVLVPGSLGNFTVTQPTITIGSIV
jgi:hypothetical protein